MLTASAFFIFTVQAALATASAPVLLAPAAGDTLLTDYPVFSWLSSDGSSQYRLEIFQILAGQSPQAAAQANPVFHDSGLLSVSTYAYPLTAPSLNSGAGYVWQVTAYGNENSVARSETRLFYSRDVSEETLPLEEREDRSAFVHARLEREMNRMAFATFKKELYLAYHNSYQTKCLQYGVYTRGGELIYAPDPDADDCSIPLASGWNYFKVNLAGAGLEYGEQYVFNAWNHRGETVQTLFLYLKPSSETHKLLEESYKKRK